MTDASRDKSHSDFSSISRPAVSTPEDHKEWTTKVERMDREALERRFVREREETRRELRGMGSGNDFSGGSTKFVNAMLTLLSALMVAGIVGGILTAGSPGTMETIRSDDSMRWEPS